MIIGDLHIHSIYSDDSINTPKLICKFALKKGLNTVAVTDHNTVRGGVETKKYARGISELNVISGTEILTDIGDIIGLYIDEEIKSRHFRDVIDEIHDLGGIAVLPHPYRDHKEIETAAELVDCIEIWNSRNRIEQNTPAAELADRYHKKKTAGSDAHLPFEIGNTICRLDDSFNFQDVRFTKTFRRANIGLSIGIRKLKNTGLLR